MGVLVLVLLLGRMAELMVVEPLAADLVRVPPSGLSTGTSTGGRRGKAEGS
jgi:hypothetical protein